MIDNWWNEIRTRRNHAGQPIKHPGYIRNIVSNCTTINKKRKTKTPNGLVDTKFLAQSRWKVCRAKTTYICSSCDNYCCHEKSSCLCLDTQSEEKH